MGAFRKGVVVGFAIGYVKGSKAGRERYEQINRRWSKVKATPTYQKAASRAQQIVGSGLYRGKLVAMDAVGKASEKMRSTGSSNGSETKNDADFSP